MRYWLVVVIALSQTAAGQAPRIEVWDGLKVPVVPETFAVISDDWQTYQLSGGTVIHLRQTVDDILRVVGRTNKDGMPIYIVKGNREMVVVHRVQKAAKSPP